MSNYIKDPTAGAAIGSIDREFNALRKWALKIQSLKKSGLLTAEYERRAAKHFVGIYRHLFLKALNGELKEKEDDGQAEKKQKG
jgi:hypothetical protein